MAVCDHFLGQLGHHDLGHFVTRLAPDINDLVVALTGSHQTRDILLLDLFDFLLGTGNDLVLFIRHQHVVNADGNTSTCRQTETRLQQLVSKHHGFLEPALPEGHIDQFGNLFLLQRLVDIGERQTFG